MGTRGKTLPHNYQELTITQSCLSAIDGENTIRPRAAAGFWLGLKAAVNGKIFSEFLRKFGFVSHTKHHMISEDLQYSEWVIWNRVMVLF